MKTEIFEKAGMELHRLRKKENKSMDEIFELYIKNNYVLNTVYKLLLGLWLSGKLSGIFQRIFVPLMVRMLDKQRLIHINVIVIGRTTTKY